MAAPGPVPPGEHLLTEKQAMLDRRKSISFKDKLFYLDLPHNKHTELLTKAICRLGGVIEGFLSRDVNYVVTGSRKALDIGNGSHVTGRRGGHCKRQATENIEPALCRGKQLLKKAIQNQECSSVLANAQSWGVCVLHVDEVLDYLEHSTHGASKSAAGNGAVCSGQTVKVGKLKSPFLKIEDQSRKYRPLQCCFSSFPELSFISSDRSPFETARTHSTHKEKDPGDQEDDDGVRSQRPHAREKSGYCECCNVTYAKLSEHLISEQHCQFAQDTSNYKVIDDITSHIVCDLMEFPDGIMQIVEGSVGDSTVNAEDTQVSIVKEKSKMGVSEVPCEQNPVLTPVENCAAHNLGEEHMQDVAHILPLQNTAASEQENNMELTMDGEGHIENKDQKPFAEDKNNDLMQCKEPLQEISGTGATSHVDVVTEVSWYTEETGMTSLYTVQSLVIPPDGQQAQLSMANALATFTPPLLLGPLAGPEAVLGADCLNQAHNAPVLVDPLSDPQFMKTGAHCNELVIDKTSVLDISGHQERFSEPSGNLCGVHLLDSIVQVPAGERRSEEMVEVQMGSIRLHKQLLLSGDQNQPLLNDPANLHTEINSALSPEQLNVRPLHEGPTDTLGVIPSSTLLTNNCDWEEQNQQTLTPFNQLLIDTPVVKHGAIPLGNQASALQKNQSNEKPLCQGPADTALSSEVANDTPLGNHASTPLQNRLNVIPSYQGPAVPHSARPLGNEATRELNHLQSATDSDKGKRKKNWSSNTQPAKKQPSQYNPLSLPMWVFHQVSDSEIQPEAHDFPDLMKRENKLVTNEGTVDPSITFNPKLLQYDVSSESEWDTGLLSQQQCKHQPGAQLGDLRTAQVNLDESWYGRELCSVLAQDQCLGSSSTTQTVTLTHASYDLYRSRVAS